MKPEDLKKLYDKLHADASKAFYILPQSEYEWRMKQEQTQDAQTQFGATSPGGMNIPPGGSSTGGWNVPYQPTFMEAGNRVLQEELVRDERNGSARKKVPKNIRSIK